MLMTLRHSTRVGGAARWVRHRDGGGGLWTRVAPERSRFVAVCRESSVGGGFATARWGGVQRSLHPPTVQVLVWLVACSVWAIHFTRTCRDTSLRTTLHALCDR